MKATTMKATNLIKTALYGAIVLAGLMASGCVSSSKVSSAPTASVGQQLQDLDKSYKDCTQFWSVLRKTGQNTHKTPIKQGCYACAPHYESITCNWLEWGEIVQLWQPMATGTQKQAGRHFPQRGFTGAYGKHPSTPESKDAPECSPGSQMPHQCRFQRRRPSSPFLSRL